MPKVSKESAPHVHHGPVEEWQEEVDGYSIDFVAFHQEIDSAPLLKGLPDDKCQCPHWGYVLKGRLIYGFADHEEVFEAGDAFYVPPGHLLLAAAGTECLQFSPADELRAVAATIMKNMQKMQGA